MKSITVENYRCFASPQTARLAPLTLLVGENSTGKTSLTAMIRALWDTSYRNRIPDFNEPPYKFGGFGTIAHRTGADRAQDAVVDAALVVAGDESGDDPFKTEVTFAARLGTARPVRRRISQGDCWIEQVHADESESENQEYSYFTTSFGVSGRTWSTEDIRRRRPPHDIGSGETLPSVSFALEAYWFLAGEDRGEAGDDPATLMRVDRDEERLHALISHFERTQWSPWEDLRPYASAPIRSEPERSYSPGSSASTVDGSHTPRHLTQLAQNSPPASRRLMEKLSRFGKKAGLFEELLARSWMTSDGDAPFEIRVRLPGSPDRYEPFNLADVGYGVSQVLPIVADLLREDSPRVSMLQQPEVHLHPSAAAALGTLFCDIIAERRKVGRQLIVETHSDFIVDRCLRAVREGDLTPDDVSVVYFERSEGEARIHNVRVDEKGHYQDYPPGFRRFFLDETARFLEFDES